LTKAHQPDRFNMRHPAQDLIPRPRIPVFSLVALRLHQIVKQ